MRVGRDIKMENKFIYEKNKLYSMIGESLCETLKRYKVILAGGCITSLFTNKEVNDLDLYFKTKEDVANFLIEVAKNEWIMAKTEKAFLFKKGELKIQTIFFKYFNSAEDIFDTFDYTVCMSAFDFEREEFVLHDDFLRHNSQKILRFNEGTAFPIISALRIQKYVVKGYFISRTEYIKVMLAILGLKVTNFKELKEQIGGMYGENYDEILEGQEGEEFDLKKIVKEISEKQNEAEYFKKSESIPFTNSFDDFESMICAMLFVDKKDIKKVKATPKCPFKENPF